MDCCVMKMGAVVGFVEMTMQWLFRRTRQWNYSQDFLQQFAILHQLGDAKIIIIMVLVLFRFPPDPHQSLSILSILWILLILIDIPFAPQLWQ